MIKCPKCGSTKVLGLKTMATPEGRNPYGCRECKWNFDANDIPKPLREWRLNEDGEGNYRLIEVLDGRLVSVGLTCKTAKPVGPQGALDCRAEAMQMFSEALQGMMQALILPPVVIKQVIEEVPV